MHCVNRQDHLKRLNYKYEMQRLCVSCSVNTWTVSSVVYAFILHFLRTFGGFCLQHKIKSVGVWGSAPDPDGGELPGSPIPPSWAREGCAPSPGRLRLHTHHYLQPDHFFYGGDGPDACVCNVHVWVLCAQCSLVPRPTSQQRMDYITAT